MTLFQFFTGNFVTGNEERESEGDRICIFQYFMHKKDIKFLNLTVSSNIIIVLEHLMTQEIKSQSVVKCITSHLTVEFPSLPIQKKC